MADYAGASVCNQVGEDVVTGETAELAKCRGDAVVLIDVKINHKV